MLNSDSVDRASTDVILQDPNLKRSLDLGTTVNKNDKAEHVEVAIEVQREGASVTSAVLNLVNTTVGAGVLSLPSGFMKIGIAFGIILTVIFGVLCWFAIWCLAKAADGLVEEELRKNKSLSVTEIKVDYKWVAKKTTPWTGYLTNVFIFMYAFGCCLAYLIVVGDAFPTVVKNNASSYTDKTWYKVFTNRQFWIGIVWIICLPFIFKKKLDSLRFASYLAFPCMCYLAGYLLVMCFVDGLGDGLKVWPTSAAGLSCVSTLAFAYCCHINYYTVYNEFAPTDRNRYASKSGAFSSVIVCIIYLLSGLCGYLVCGQDTQGNVINSLPGNAASTVARIAVGIAVAFSYPLMFNPSRMSILALLKKFQYFKFMNAKQAKIVHVVLTIIITLVSLIALAVDNVSIILNYVGCLAAPATSYIIPGYYYWKVFHNKEGYKLYSFLSAAFAVFGVVLMILGFIVETLANAHVI